MLFCQSIIEIMSSRVVLLVRINTPFQRFGICCGGFHGRLMVLLRMVIDWEVVDESLSKIRGKGLAVL